MNRLHPARWSVHTWLVVILGVGLLGLVGGAQ